MTTNTRFYLDIYRKGYQFRELVLQGKSQGAIETLQKIERVLKEQKPYIPLSKDDPFALLPGRRQRLRLQQIAQTIADNYLKKGCLACCFNEKTNPTYQKIKAICLRIDNLISPPDAFPFPENVHFKICEQIHKSYLIIAALNRTGRQIAKEYVLFKARQWGYSPKSVRDALHYLNKLEAEESILVKQGFIPQGIRLCSPQELSKIISPISKYHAQKNKKTESLFHFVASNNLPKVIEFAVSTFPKLVNHKIFGKTPAIVASEMGHKKVMRRLMEKGADMEGSFPASIYLTSWMLQDIFSHLTTPQDLLAVGNVSKDWRIVSQENRLWEPVYQKFFPKATPTSSKDKPSRYWETKFMRFYKNAANGFYVEELLSEDFWRSQTENIMLAGNFIIFLRPNIPPYTPSVWELWTTSSGTYRLIRKISDVSKLVPQGVAPRRVNNTLLTSSFLIITAGEHVRFILNESGNHFDMHYPSKVFKCLGVEDRVIVQLENDTLHAVCPQNQNTEMNAYQIRLPPLFQQNTPRSVAANDQWIALQDGREIVLLKNNREGKPKIFNQKLKLLARNIPSKLVFSKTYDGTLILIAEASSEDNSGFSIWFFDEARNHWTLAVKMKGMKMLGQDGDFLFLTENFFSITKWDSSLKTGTAARNIISYKWNGKVFDQVCQYHHPIQMNIDGNEAPKPSSLEHLLEEHYSFRVKNGLLVVADKQPKDRLPGNFTIFDGRHKDSRHKFFPRGTIEDLGEDTRSKHGKVDGVLGEWNFFHQWKPFFTYPNNLTLVGFTTEGSLVLNEELHGIFIRRFDATSSEILTDIAERFKHKFLLNHFGFEVSCSRVADIYNRFRRFDADTQKEVLRQLYKIIKGKQWNYILTFDDDDKIAHDAFFGNNNRLTNGLKISDAILTYVGFLEQRKKRY